MRALLIAGFASAVACGRTTQTLRKAGDPGDEGDGILGKLSTSTLTTADEGGDDDDVSDPRDNDSGDLGGGYRHGRGRGRRYDAARDPADPAAFGGAAYGGDAYAGFYVRPWSVNTPSRTPEYVQQGYLEGALEGTIRWQGAVPAPLTTACGRVPAMAVAGDHALAGAVVWIARVRTGRTVTGEEERPLPVGGTVVKRGCAFSPSAQVLAPLPAAFTVHNDARPTRVRMTPEGAEPTFVELEAGARTAMSMATPRVTRVDSADGSLGAAFVVGVGTYYYAVTDDRGHYRIDELAPGAYELSIWHPPLPKLVAGALVYDQAITTTRRFTVPKSGTAHLDVALSR